MNKSWLGHVAALMVVIVWGTTFVSSKVLLNSGMSPDEIFLCRGAIAYLSLLIIYHKRVWCDTWRDELVMLGLGITGSSLYFMTENTALIYDTSSNVSILVGSTPLLTALLVCALDKTEHMSRRQVFGSVIAFLGMTLIVLNGQIVLHLNPLGDALAICAALTWACYSYLMRSVSSRYRSAFITRKVFFYGVLTISPVVMWNGAPSFTLSFLSQPRIIGNILFLGILASFLGFVIWNWVLSRIGTIKATNYVYMQSLVTIIAAAMVLGERITVMAVIGMAVLIIGMVMAQREKKISSETNF